MGALLVGARAMPAYCETRVRGLMGMALLVGAAFSFGHSAWLGIFLAAVGLFGLFEAVRGWCFARACGLRTKL